MVRDILLDARADVDQRDNDGFTPRDLIDLSHEHAESLIFRGFRAPLPIALHFQQQIADSYLEPRSQDEEGGMKLFRDHNGGFSTLIPEDVRQNLEQMFETAMENVKAGNFTGDLMTGFY